MATSIGQHTPVFLLEGPPFLPEKPGGPQSSGSPRVGRNRSDPVRIDARLFLPVQLCPVRVECEGGAAAWLVGTLAAPSVQRHRLPLLQELWPYQSFLMPLVAGNPKASLASLLSVALPIQALTGFPGWGPTL